MTAEARAEPLDAFRARAEAFYRAHAAPRRARQVAWGVGSDAVAPAIVAPRQSDDDERAAAAEARAWQERMFDAGMAWLTGPVELGGQGLTAEHERIRAEVAAAFDTPDDTLVRTGAAVLGPALLRYGTEHVRTEHLPRIHRGRELMCQLFSEPGAGSDLANITTTARPDSDDPGAGWILEGQKVWSSGAHHADTGLCIARTAPDSARHAGLSAFVVHLDAPGVEIRRIRQMTEGAEFCEVFLDGAPVDGEHLVGPLDGGWAVVIDILMHERSTIGRALLPERAVFDQLALLVARRARDDALTRRDLAAVYERLFVAGAFVDRVLGSTPPGATPGPELALAKLAVTDVLGRIGALATRVVGPAATARTGEWGTWCWADLVLGVPGMRIGGGTDEVLRNGIAERVLGLPREPVAR